MDLSDIVIVSACRTPLGKFGGSLRDIPAYDLGAIVLNESLNRANIEGKEIDSVILGNTRQAGNGPNPARTASVKGGIPINIPAETLNMGCPSSMRALSHCASQIMLGQADTLIAGGMESMSSIPYLLKDARWEGFRMGDRVLMDGWNDTIDPLCGKGIGGTAENLHNKYDISKKEQDRFAYASMKKAKKARDNGSFKDEIVPVNIKTESGEPAFLSTDESIKDDINMDELAALPPVFSEEGTVTAGNSCPKADGACAAVVMSRKKAISLGLKPLFSIVSFSATAVEPSYMHEGPGIAIPLALKNAGMTLKDMDLMEVNEVFAIQVLANESILRWDREKLNINGGSIAIGNPTGMTGLRIIITLYNALKQRDKEFGIASLCGVGGVTMATIIKRES